MRSSVFEIIRRHLSLPVNVEYEAMKTVLRELRHYNEFTPLHEKPTFYAELQVQVTRYRSINTPSVKTRNPCSSSSTLANRERFQTRKVVPLQLWTAVLPWETQRGLSFSNLWKVKEQYMKPTDEEVVEHEQQAVEEEQQETLELSKDKFSDVKNVKCNIGNNEQSSMYDEWDDPLTVISYPSNCSTNIEHSTKTVENMESNNKPPLPPPYKSFLQSSSSLSVHSASHTPGMLFLMKVPTIKENGLHFWSGAITHSIDVLFAAALSETAIHASYSFSQLRQELAQSQVNNNEVDPRLLREYFPLNELHSSNTQLRVTSYGHLDPFPECTVAIGSKGNEKDKAEKIINPNYTISSEAEHDGMNFNYYTNKMEKKITSHYVLETLRHVTQDVVQQALDESASIVHNLEVQHNHNHNNNMKQNDKEEEESDIEIELRLELSQELKDDLLQKAQLACRYVPDLEDCIAYHLRRRHELSSTDSQEDNGVVNGGSRKLWEEEEKEKNVNYGNSQNEMFSGGTSFANHNSQNTSRQGKRKNIQVWLSEHESVWMTEDEIRAQQHAALTKQKLNNKTNNDNIENLKDDKNDNEDDNDDDAYMQQEEQEEQLEEEQDEEANEAKIECNTVNEEVEKKKNGNCSHDDGLTTSDAHSHISNYSNRVDATITNVEEQENYVIAEDVSNSVLETKSMRSYSPRSLASQSPMLVEEDEAKPKVLTPSFVGRHSGTTLHQVKEIVSARHLSRYVNSNPELPQEAPIDYELFELCIRLDVAVNTVLMCYYERLLREWRQELWFLRHIRPQHNINSDSTNDSTITNNTHYCVRISDDDVQRMYDLVHDESLQLPEELKSVVNAVAKLRSTL